MSDDEKYWDDVASRYGGLYDNTWSRFEDSITQRDVLRLLRGAPGERVLDIGCGTGLGYELLGGAESKVSYVGVDISSAMLSEFRKKHSAVNTYQASGDCLAKVFGHGQFDLVIAINVAASFPTRTRRMLEEVRRILAPGGVIYLSFLNRRSLRRMVHGLRGVDEAYRTRGDHESADFVWAKTYSRRSLVSMCQAVGFGHVRCVYRSVLGGVWESAAAVSAESVLQRMAPCLGHAVVVTGRRGGEVANDDQMETVL
jgi:ubiquinone/menaquinone biosynthesis C-methylase UbiE